MDFFEALERRRSVRKYTSKPVPEEVILRAIDAALIAPNSSNMQTWRIYWVRDAEKKEKLIKACFSQGAAATAQELLVFTAEPATWKFTQKAILQNLGPKAPQKAREYYTKVMPIAYGYRIFAPIKWLVFNGIGLFKPMARRPWSSRDISEVAIKSAALACENFMLAISALGFDTCPMEGLDEARVAKLLPLTRGARIVMAISVGERDPDGVWGPRFRLPRDVVFRQV